MLRQLRPALVMIVAMTLLTGLFYPLAITGVAAVVFPWAATGSLIESNGKIVGSDLIGQAFTSDRYFHGRPSATTGPDPADSSKTASAPYNASNSGGSNLAPTNRALLERIADDAAKLKAESSQPILVDMVTTSGSGLDPHISPEAAQFQVARVAKARDMSVEQVQQVVAQHVEGRILGFIGEPRVNVLRLNLAMDQLKR